MPRVNVFGYLDEKWYGARQFVLRRLLLLSQLGLDLHLHLRGATDELGMFTNLPNEGRLSPVAHSGMNYIFNGRSGGMLLSLMRRLRLMSKLIIDDGGDSFEYAGSESARSYGRVLESTDRIVVQTSAYKKFLLGKFPTIEPDRILVVPHCAPEGFFSAKPNNELNNWKGEELLVGHSGRLTSAQEQIYLELLQRRGFRLLFIGGGEVPWAKDFGHRVQVVSHLPLPDLASRLRACDFFVVLYPRDYKVIPMKLIDYMALGKPVFMNKFDGLDDISADAYVGVDQEDPIPNILQYLRDHDRNTVERAARQFAMAYFSEKRVTLELSRALS